MLDRPGSECRDVSVCLKYKKEVCGVLSAHLPLAMALYGEISVLFFVLLHDDSRVVAAESE